MPKKIPKIYYRDRRLSNLYRIVDKKGQEITYSHNPAQQRLDDYIGKLRRRNEKTGKPLRLIILKARQLGVTTYARINALDDTIIRSNRTNMIVAHNLDKQQEIFQRVRQAYRRMPTVRTCNNTIRRKPTANFDNKNMLYFGAKSWAAATDQEKNSKIQVTLDARSGTATAIHITELAFRRDAREMMAGTMPAVENGDVVIETTANGVGNYFHKLRIDNHNISWSVYDTVFIARYRDPHYSTELEEGEELVLPEELAHLETIDETTLTPQQKKRYLEKRKELGRDVFQEFPSTPEEAFLTTGRTVFDTQLLQRLPVIQYRDNRTHSGLRLYKSKFNASHYYRWVDTAEGWPEWDFSAISVRDPQLNLVASYYERLPPDLLCEVIQYLYERGMTRGVIGIERNNTGLTTITKARDYKRFPLLYTEEILDQATQRRTRKVWRNTTAKSRPLMMGEYEVAVRRGYMREYDERVRGEMHTLIYNARNKQEAAPWCHDDGVIADAICYQMRKARYIDPSLMLRPL